MMKLATLLRRWLRLRGEGSSVNIRNAKTSDSVSSSDYDNSILPHVVDPEQLRRIESTHRGFFYQHLFAVGCLLVAQRSGVQKVIVERDEDLELEMAQGRIYIQVKTRNSSLQWSDISATLDNFAEIRNQHLSGKRNGKPEFYVVANSEPSSTLNSKLQSSDWPKDVYILSPIDTIHPDFLPPAWTSINAALEWCKRQASQIPFLTVAEDVLIWKLAAITQCACTGSGTYDHHFSVGDLPTLFSQVLIQLQGFPDTARPYLPHTNEPPYSLNKPHRAIFGLSGSGKTAWVAEASSLMPDSSVYFDVGDTPAPAIAAGIVQEIAGRLFKENAEVRSNILLPGNSGLNALRILEKILSSQRLSITVFVDNCQRLQPDIILALAEFSKSIRWVFVSQPHPEQNAWLSRLQLTPEELSGWNADTIASRFRGHGCAISYQTAESVRHLTSGLPLFVQSVMALAVEHYGNDVELCCREMRDAVHVSMTAQDVILNAIRDKLSSDARAVVVALSLTDAPLAVEEVKSLLAHGLQINERIVSRCVRELHSLGIVQLHRGREVSLHDSFRTKAAELVEDLGKHSELNLRKSLKDLLVTSLKDKPDFHRQCELIRLLPLIGQTEKLVELASNASEYLRELGLIPSISVVLRKYIDQKEAKPIDRFYALDTLALWANVDKNYEAFDLMTTEMECLYDSASLGRKERGALATKRLLRFGRNGDFAGIQNEMKQIQDVLESDPEFRRILVYGCAASLFYAGKYLESAEMAGEVAEEYFELLGFQGNLASQNLPQIWEGITKTEEVHSDLRRLADCLDLFAMAMGKLNRESFPARLHAHKFYVLAGAYRSAIRVGQDFADEILRISNDPFEARMFIEQSLLSAVSEFRLLEYAVAVRSQYAVVLAYCGDISLARREMSALLQFANDDPDSQEELSRQSSLIEEIANGYNPYLERRLALEHMRHIVNQRINNPLPHGRKDRLGRNDPCHCGSGKKFKYCHGRR